MIHAHTFGVIVCGAEVEQKAVAWSHVTCRECCTRGTGNLAAARLAELDREQSLGFVISNGVQAFGFDVKAVAPVMPVVNRNVNITALLTRLGDFIASIPGNALDRKSNAVAMELRREIADVVCPTDKVRK